MSKKYIFTRIESCDKAKTTQMLRHNLRERVSNSDIDKTRSHLNEYWINQKYVHLSTDEIAEAVLSDMAQLYEEKQHKKLSKLAVPCKQMYILMTKDPSLSIEEHKEVLLNAYSNMKQYLDENNIEIVQFAMHLDEETPHIHLLIKNQQLHNGKTLRNFFTRTELTKHQDIVSKDAKYGYIRGEKNSRNRHISMRDMKKLELKKLDKKLNRAKTKLRETERAYCINYAKKKKLKTENYIYYRKTKKLKKQLSSYDLHLLRVEALIREYQIILNELKQEIDRHEQLLSIVKQQYSQEQSKAQNLYKFIEEKENYGKKVDQDNLIKEQYSKQLDQEIETKEQYSNQLDKTIETKEQKLNELDKATERYRTLISKLKVFERDHRQNQTAVRICNKYGKLLTHARNNSTRDIIPTIDEFLKEIRKANVNLQDQLYQAVEKEGQKIINNFSNIFDMDNN